MSNRLTTPPPQPPVQNRAALQQKYARSRHELLLVIVFTLINLALVALDSGVMFLFSASIPYISVVFGVVLGLPALLGVAIFIAAVSLVLYFLCWLLCKRHSGWMVVALIMFILDTLFLVGFYLLAQDFSGIIDLIIHVVVLYHLIVGVRSGFRLKKLPEEEEAPFVPQYAEDYDRGGDYEGDLTEDAEPVSRETVHMIETVPADMADESDDPDHESEADYESEAAFESESDSDSDC